LKLLLDENLSPRLVNRLGLLFPALTHVRDVALKQAADRDISSWAKDNDFGILRATPTSWNSPSDSELLRR